VSTIQDASAHAGQGFVLAAIKVTPRRWEKEANLAALERYAREAAARGAQVVVAPEGFLEGYVGNAKANPDLTAERYASVGEPLDGPLMTRVRDLARELAIYLATGFAERRDGLTFNSVAVFGPDGALVLHYSKSHTAADEPYNTKGDTFSVATTTLGCWGALICFDRQLPETARILALRGAQLVLVPAWGAHGEMNDVMMRTRAYENGVYVAFVHPKRVLIVDPRGTVVAQDAQPGDEIVLGCIVLDQRVGSGPIRGRRPELYADLARPTSPAPALGAGDRK
jgi:5-aminopentanamidase